MSDNGAIISGMYASFAKGDVPAVLGLLDPKVEWREADGLPSLGGTYNGPDAVLNGVFMPLGTDWDGFTVTPDEIVASGDRVIAMGHYAGKYKATGKSFRTPFAPAWRFANGKVVNFHQYTDTAIVQEATERSATEQPNQVPSESDCHNNGIRWPFLKAMDVW